MTIYLALLAFDSSAIYLLATTKDSVFFFRVCLLLPNILASSAYRS